MPADLTSLMQLAPMQGAYMTGQQFGLDNASQIGHQQDLQSLIAARDAERRRADEMQPYAIGEQKDKSLAAALKRQKDQLDYDKAAATKDSDIKLALAKNTDDEEKLRSESFRRAEENFLRIIPEMQMTPGPLQSQVFRQRLMDAGMNPDAPHLQTLSRAAGTPMFNKMLEDTLKKVQAQKLMMDTQYQSNVRGHEIAAGSAREVANIHAASSKEVANIHAASAKETANIQAEARKAAKNPSDLLTGVRTKKFTPAQAAVAAKFEAEFGGHDEFTASRYQQLADMFEQMAINQNPGEGRPTIDDKGGITPRTIPRTLNTPADGKPKQGTAQNPIVLK